MGDGTGWNRHKEYSMVTALKELETILQYNIRYIDGDWICYF